MGYLLDTHILIWFLEGDQKLKEKFRNAITDSLDPKYVSIASIWKIAIKTSLNRLETDFSIEEITELIESNGLLVLPIEHKHCLEIVTLLFHHKDPFDRMLIAQAISEDLTIITQDQYFKLYEAKVL